MDNDLTNGIAYHHSVSEDKDFADLLNHIEAKSESGDGGKREQSKQKPFLVKALANTFLGYYSLAGILLLTYDIVAFANPMILR